MYIYIYFFLIPGSRSRFLPADFLAVLLRRVVVCLGIDVDAVLCTDSRLLCCVLVLCVNFCRVVLFFSESFEPIYSGTTNLFT